MDMHFEKYTFSKRLKSMLKVDFRRMFTMPLVYIMMGICVIAPVLILVMTTMMDGTVSVNPQTGEETVIEGFDNTWQIIGTAFEENAATSADTSADAMGGMDMMSMCNINLIFFGVSALVCIFTSEDFRSGYAKNLFTVRAKKSDFVISKTLVLFVAGALMVVCFFIGTMLGGAIAGLSFEMNGFTTANLIMSIIAKMMLMSVFVALYLLMSVIAKSRLWLSILLSLMTGMFLFMMIPMLTPINAQLTHILICTAGGAVFAAGLGAISNAVLKKTALV